MKVVKWQQLNSTFKLTFHTSEDIVLKEFMTKTEPILYIKLVTWNLTLRRIESFDYPGSASYLLGKAFVTERMRYIFNASHWLRPRSAIDRKWTLINMKIHIIAMAYGCQLNESMITIKSIFFQLVSSMFSTQQRKHWILHHNPPASSYSSPHRRHVIRTKI